MTKAMKHEYFKATHDLPLLDAIESYNTGKPIKIAELFRIYQEEHRGKNSHSESLCRTDFYNLLKHLHDPVEAAHASGDYAKAKKLARGVNQRFEVNGYLSRMEMDAIHSPIGLIHPITFDYVGMPIDYFSIDASTRGIPGHVTDGFGKGERAEQVVRLLQNSLLPKRDDVERYGTKHQNPFFGNSKISSNDPGSAFCNDLVLSFMCDFQIDQVIEKTAQPWLRPFIERFFWTFVTLFLCKLPGFFPKANNISDRLARATKEATLTVWEYEVLVKRFINDIYHLRPHKGLFDQTPIQKLKEELERDDSPIFRTLPHNWKVMSEYCIKLPRQRAIQEHKGIQIDNRMYQDTSITGEIYRWLKKNRKATKVDTYIDHSNFGYIRIRDPRNNNLVAVRYSCMESGHRSDDLEDLGISTAHEEELEKLSVMTSDQIIDNAKSRKRKIDKVKREKRRQPKQPAQLIQELNEDDLCIALSIPPRASMLRHEAVSSAREMDVIQNHDATDTDNETFKLRY